MQAPFYSRQRDMYLSRLSFVLTPTAALRVPVRSILYLFIKISIYFLRDEMRVNFAYLWPWLRLTLRINRIYKSGRIPEPALSLLDVFRKQAKPPILGISSRTGK